MNSVIRVMCILNF